MKGTQGAVEPRKDSFINLSYGIIANSQDSVIAESIKSSIYLSKQLWKVDMPVKGLLRLELAYTRQESNTASQGCIVR